MRSVCYVKLALLRRLSDNAVVLSNLKLSLLDRAHRIRLLGGARLKRNNLVFVPRPARILACRCSSCSSCGRIPAEEEQQQQQQQQQQQPSK